MSCAVIRIRLPAPRTRPSAIFRTPRSAATSRTFTDFPKANADADLWPDIICKRGIRFGVRRLEGECGAHGIGRLGELRDKRVAAYLRSAAGVPVNLSESARKAARIRS